MGCVESRLLHTLVVVAAVDPQVVAPKSSLSGAGSRLRPAKAGPARAASIALMRRRPFNDPRAWNVILEYAVVVALGRAQAQLALAVGHGEKGLASGDLRMQQAAVEKAGETRIAHRQPAEALGAALSRRLAFAFIRCANRCTSVVDHKRSHIAIPKPA